MKWSYAYLSNITDNDLQKIYDNAEKGRKAYFDRIKADNKRRQSLAGEWLIKQLLAKQFGILNAVICRDKNGRPYVKENRIFISIAHSGDLVAVAADYSAIGIDVEKIRPNKLNLADRICLPREKEYIFAAPDLSLYRFYEVWTAKEAYFKKQGTGITDFKSVDILSLDRNIFDIDDYLIQII